MRDHSRIAFARRVLLALVAVGAAASAARAQTPSPPDERPLLMIGPVEVRPRFLVSNVGFDNNVFNENENPKRDFTFTLSPDVQLSVNPGRLHLSYTGGSDFVYFNKYTSERSVNRNFQARADVDLAYLKPFVSVSANQTSARASSEIDVRARRHPRTYEAGTVFKLTGNLSASVSMRQAIERFDDGTLFRGVDLAETLNSKTTIYESTIGIDLTPLTAVSLVVSDEQMRFDHSPDRDSDTLRIAPTVRFNPGGILSGSASVGYRRFRGREDTFENYSGVVATGIVGASIADRFRVETTFTRDVKYSFETTLPYYVLSSARATLTTLLAGGFEIRVTGGRESMGYRAFAGQEAPGTDSVLVYGGGIGYQLANRARLRLESEFTSRTSARDPSRQYDNRRIFAAFTWGSTR